jgi:hypothetical protein
MRWTTPRSHGPPRIGSNKDRRARRHAGRSEASSHSGAWELVGEGEKERGEHRGPFAGLTKARVVVWRRGNGDEVAAEEELDGGSAQAWRVGEKKRGRCGEKRQESPPFYRGQRVVRGGSDNGRRLRGLMPLMVRGLRRGLRGGIKAGV